MDNLCLVLLHTHACARTHICLRIHRDTITWTCICQARQLLNCFALEHMMVLYVLYAFIVIIFSPDIAVRGHGMDIALLLIVFYMLLSMQTHCTPDACDSTWVTSFFMDIVSTERWWGRCCWTLGALRKALLAQARQKPPKTWPRLSLSRSALCTLQFWATCGLSFSPTTPSTLPHLMPLLVYCESCWGTSPILPQSAVRCILPIPSTPPTASSVLGVHMGPHPCSLL